MKNCMNCVNYNSYCDDEDPETGACIAWDIWCSKLVLLDHWDYTIAETCLHYKETEE